MILDGRYFFTKPIKAGVDFVCEDWRERLCPYPFSKNLFILATQFNSYESGKNPQGVSTVLPKTSSAEYQSPQGGDLRFGLFGPSEPKIGLFGFFTKKRRKMVDLSIAIRFFSFLSV